MNSSILTLDLTADTVPARLIAQILEHAKSRGIDQAALAARAGLTQESLSRLKKAGSCRVPTLLDLARAAGFTTLAFSEPGPEGAAASVAARKLSAGRRRAVSGEELAAALRAHEPPLEFTPHLYGFFEELPVAAVHDVILEQGLEFARLAAFAAALGAEGETVDWLGEMAGDGVARAA